MRCTTAAAPSGPVQAQVDVLDKNHIPMSKNQDAH